jgi:hypothetical protein
LDGDRDDEQAARWLKHPTPTSPSLEVEAVTNPLDL